MGGAWLFPTAVNLPGATEEWGAGAPPSPAPPRVNPLVDAANGCPAYFNSVNYKTYRKLNTPPGNFVVESETIRQGYWWKVLYADGRLQTTAAENMVFQLAPESSRGQAMEQSSSGPNADLPEGILLMGNQAGAATYGGITVPDGFTGLQCPVYPLIIPNGFFLRVAVLSLGNGAQSGVGMVLRMAYLELPVGDPGPSW